MTRQRRALIILLAAVGVLAAIFLVTKLVVPHTAPSNPIAPLTGAIGKARAVAGASNAAGAKLSAAGGDTVPAQAATTTTTKAPVAASTQNGPPPNTTRNPFLP